MPENSSNKMKYLTQQEAIRLFNAIIFSDNSHAVRDLALFRVAYRCGLRASEISLIKLDDYTTQIKEIFTAKD
ncbi:phage integrase family protein [Clostridium botulinum]|nr:phage integrase family protein [Clostridium botulinum]